MHKYTLGFIKRNNCILMVNRQKSPWKGSWNGVGGKLNENESPLECIIREIKEETDIDVSTLEILDDRERGIIECYFGLNRDCEPMTLEAIGDRYSLTKERIRQIKEQAIRRLRHNNKELYLLLNR